MEHIFEDVIESEYAPVNEASIPQYEAIYDKLKTLLPDETQLDEMLSLVNDLEEVLFKQGFIRGIARAKMSTQIV